jgi:hypothetical protein
MAILFLQVCYDFLTQTAPTYFAQEMNSIKAC